MSTNHSTATRGATAVVPLSDRRSERSATREPSTPKLAAQLMHQTVDLATTVDELAQRRIGRGELWLAAGAEEILRRQADWLEQIAYEIEMDGCWTGVDGRPLIPLARRAAA